MYIERTCPFCKITYGLEIDVEQGQLDDWEYGKMIQHAMPNLTPNEREHIMSGICPSCWPNDSATGNDEELDKRADEAIADMESIIEALDRNPPKE